MIFLRRCTSFIHTLESLPVNTTSSIYLDHNGVHYEPILEVDNSESTDTKCLFLKFSISITMQPTFIRTFRYSNITTSPIPISICINQPQLSELLLIQAVLFGTNEFG